MSFYNALQMDPSILKKYIYKSENVKEKSFYWAAMAIRSLLIVIFAILFISTLSNIFGQENTPLAVALFCIFLGIRFVNFEYCISDSLITLAIAITILALSPVVASILPAYGTVIVHFISFFSLLYITSQKPELGNGGLYSFAYIYLSGTPVFGLALSKRIFLAIVGYLMCSIILVFKHHNSHSKVRFHHIIFKFDLHNIVHLWQLRMAIGVSLILTLGQYFNIERFMWAGFACSSLLCEYPYSISVNSRFFQRIVGVLAGSGLFYILYSVIPGGFQSLIGPLGGFCLGFCTDYRYKTAMNCFGALMIAAGIYGIQDAIFLRIIDTLFGVIFAMIFAITFHKLIGRKFHLANSK